VIPCGCGAIQQNWQTIIGFASSAVDCSGPQPNHRIEYQTTYLCINHLALNSARTSKYAVPWRYSYVSNECTEACRLWRSGVTRLSAETAA